MLLYVAPDRLTIILHTFTIIEIVNMGFRELCNRHGFVTSASLARSLGISRQAAHRRLAAAVAAGELVAEGAARARRYLLTVPSFEFELVGAAEDELFDRVRARLAAQFATLAAEERGILSYTFTELVNNAIEHSHGTRGRIRAEIASEHIDLEIDDDGIGAFESVRRGRDLRNHIEAAAEITKGKVTTMPERHTGEGVFFTSKVADRFSLAANAVELVVDNAVEDHAIRAIAAAVGTTVRLRVSRPPLRTLQSVFAAWSDDFEFTKTRTVVKLFALGRDFVSRSEARRILHGLEVFREIVVDFQDVDGIGQGFADEVFRVFAQQHPTIRLVPVNMVETVRFFVERAERARDPMR